MLSKGRRVQFRCGRVTNAFFFVLSKNPSLNLQYLQCSYPLALDLVALLAQLGKCE